MTRRLDRAFPRDLRGGYEKVGGIVVLVEKRARMVDVSLL